MSKDWTRIIWLLGGEGWFTPAKNIANGSDAYSGIEGIGGLANIQIETRDYGVVHLYPDSWGYEDPWSMTWIEEHTTTGFAFSKPIILEDYGAPNPHNHIPTEGPWQYAVYNSTITADQI
jgi:mannan endo-1,4-beta-mannosidase